MGEQEVGVIAKRQTLLKDRKMWRTMFADALKGYDTSKKKINIWNQVKIEMAYIPGCPKSVIDIPSNKPVFLDRCLIIQELVHRVRVSLGVSGKVIYENLDIEKVFFLLFQK